jgi:3-hydroxybutyryl-CoA dehydrogenase
MFTNLFDSAQTLASNDIASVEDIDRVWMGVMHMPIGPFGLMDSVGLETVWHVTNFWAKNTGDPQKDHECGVHKKIRRQRRVGTKDQKGILHIPEPVVWVPGFFEGH